MKNIIKIVILLICCQFNAQTIIPVEQMSNFSTGGTAKNHYFKDVNGTFNAFLGNWKYETGTDKVEISIYKDENVESGLGFSCDEVYILFKYTQNGNLIFDTFHMTEKYFISGGRFRIPTNTNKLHILYREPYQNPHSIQQWIDLEFIPNAAGQPQLHWVTHYESTNIENETPPQMPLNMVFVKQ